MYLMADSELCSFEKQGQIDIIFFHGLYLNPCCQLPHFSSSWDYFFNNSFFEVEFMPWNPLTFSILIEVCSHTQPIFQYFCHPRKKGHTYNQSLTIPSFPSLLVTTNLLSFFVGLFRLCNSCQFNHAICGLSWSTSLT